MTTIDATTIRIALIDYRTALLQLFNGYPHVYTTLGDKIKQIDDALLSIEGNITTVQIIPNTCNPNR
jgi:hypothetical protein